MDTLKEIKITSIFNDVLGPIMRGPSSSHTAASVRIGLLCRHLMPDFQFDHVRITFDEFGSLATTHEPQGSDIGLCGGLLGFECDDERLLSSVETLKSSGIKLSFLVLPLHDTHPNTYRISIKKKGGESHSMVALSTGGGAIHVIEIDNHKVDFRGDTSVSLPYLSVGVLPAVLPVPILKFDNDKKPLFTSPQELNELIVSVNNKLGKYQFLSQIGIEYECFLSGLDISEIKNKMKNVIRIYRNAIKAGLEGTNFKDRILHSQSPLYSKSESNGILLPVGALHNVIKYTSAMMEAKSSMLPIVAGPTAGSCGVVPGSLLAMCDAMKADETTIINIFFAASIIGVAIAQDPGSTFAAEEGGCQAECGSASAMATAGLIELMGGNASIASNGASMALQSTLGMICDPVANRVEAPCLYRNTLAASNAVTCANMAMAGFDGVIPLHEVIEVHFDVGNRMPRELRCTGLAGLAQTKTSKEIEKKLSCHCSSNGSTSCNNTW